jgi:DNA processing protein
LVENAHDVLEELQLAPQQQIDLLTDALNTNNTHDTEHPVLTHMGFAPVSLDALQARCGLDTAALQAQLLTLELNGVVGRLPGGLFQRLTAA